jgi:hypothetical protein
VGASHVVAPDLPCWKDIPGAGAVHAAAPDPACGMATPGAAEDHVAALDLTSQEGRSQSRHLDVDPVFKL